MATGWAGEMMTAGGTVRVWRGRGGWEGGWEGGGCEKGERREKYMFR